MAFQRPTLADLIERITSDFQSRLQLAGALLRRSVVVVIARILAGATHGLYGYLDFLSKQIFPDTSDAEFLERHASLFRVQRNPATFATGAVVFTGTNGSVVPAGTILQRADGLQYETDADGTIAAGTATVGITALEASSNGNAPVGTVLSFVSPVESIDATCTVGTGGITAGDDQETIEALRLRVLERMQSPPHGGADFDYIAWAKQVTGVTRAWVYPEELGYGTVVVRFVRDNDEDIIPSAGEVEDVQTYIDAVRPVTAAVTVVAPVPVEVDFTIAITPDNSATRLAITAELEDLLTREAEPGGTILISHIREAISVAAGEYDHTLTVPSGNVTNDTGEISVMGAITWA